MFSSTWVSTSGILVFFGFGVASSIAQDTSRNKPPSASGRGETRKRNSSSLQDSYTTPCGFLPEFYSLLILAFYAQYRVLRTIPREPYYSTASKGKSGDSSFEHFCCKAAEPEAILLAVSQKWLFTPCLHSCA